MLQRILKKAMGQDDLTDDEIATLFKIPASSKESFQIQDLALQKSIHACDDYAEVHAQIGLNIAPCPNNCKFCAFAESNHVFREPCELSVSQAVANARQFEAEGANAIYIMITANYSFEKFLEISQEIRHALHPDTILIANIGDLSPKQAQQLKDVGYAGIYHAVRLGEGRDTLIDPQKRLESFQNARDAGLLLGTCLEPIGTEHSIDELVEKTIISRDAHPIYSGAARRIPIPQTELASQGLVSEPQMAHILAVVRLALGYEIAGTCTHEPNIIGALAGANLLWAEAGSNPRDPEKETRGKHGMTVKECRHILKDAGWKILAGPSRFYGSSEQVAVQELAS